jgi:predicted phage tail protein
MATPDSNDGTHFAILQDHVIPQGQRLPVLIGERTIRQVN